MACGELTRAPSTRTPSFNAAAAGAGGRTGARRGSGVTPPSHRRHLPRGPQLRQSSGTGRHTTAAV